jgi:MoaA/NifB/PqqE/SkfB family radical SAM enzyme
MFENIKAIRSLQCKDHAINLTPTVLSICWFLGKRCNYDCTYCGPHSHDLISPFVDLEQSLAFIEKSNHWALSNNKKIKWAFTGGEPFIDPGFLKLVQTLAKSPATEQINAVTNGSLPLSHYCKFLDVLAGITFSVHLERSDSEIQKTIDIMANLTDQGKIFVSCNLMFLPGKQTKIEQIISQLQQHNIKFVLRKISPIYEDGSLSPFESKSDFKKSMKLIPISQQSIRKEKWRTLRDRELSTLAQCYYSEQELDYLDKVNTQPVWHNMGIWHGEDQYDEINTDLLLALGKNQFRNWICYAGVDSLYIDFDGKLYRGLCQGGGSIGHIQNWSGFQAEPVVCDRNWCTCNFDIPVRKSQNTESIELITG